MTVAGAPDTRSHEQLVFRYILERRAREHPGRRFASFMATGESWTWADLDRHANRLANALAAAGTRKGQAVALMASNSPAFLQAFFGVTKLGGLITPVNTGFRGNMLRHVLSISEPRVVICETGFLARFEDIAGDLRLDRVVVAGEYDASCCPRLAETTQLQSFEDFVASGGVEAPPDPDLRFWDPYGIIFTSGTTGPSKGVLACYGQFYAMVQHTLMAHARADDVFLVDLPLFHVGALLSLSTVLQLGAAAAIGPRVQIEGYWERIRRYGVTHITLLPQIGAWLWNQPPSPSDADHRPLRVLIGKYPAYIHDWCSRFGVESTYSSFNMTEISSPLVLGLNPANLAASGRPRPGVVLRLVDEFDMEVPEGEAGELVVRTDLPWEMNLGYVNMPEATARAWRNGWFHTGDTFRRDADGYYYYVDRVKDAIRRRGENISSFEVEEAIAAHPAVLECSAVAARPDDSLDDEVLAFVVLKGGTSLDPAELIEFLRPRLTYFMIPRYLEFLDALPRNQSTRVLKRELRERGIAENTWDREKAGIVISGKAEQRERC